MLTTTKMGEYTESMPKAYASWMIYSIGIFIAWAVVFFLRWKLKGDQGMPQLALVFFGFFLGWASATIKFILVKKKIYDKMPKTKEK